jgi:hypothetical protein
MSLINAFFRFVQGARSSVAPVSQPVAVQSSLLKSISGGSGTGSAPFNIW